jgi:hypothetical protein
MAECCEWTGTALLRQAALSPQGLRTFENIAALKEFRVSTPQNGTLAWVLSVQDAFEYQADSTLADDGITIVTPVSSIGRWLRLNLPNERWARQTTWHINADTGIDENDGFTASTALKSHAEFARRVNRLTLVGAPVTVVVHTDLHEIIRLDVNLHGVSEGGISPSSIAYSGQAVEVLASGTITSALGADPGLNQAPSLTDSAVADWTPLLSRRIRLVTGDATRNGAMAWLLKWGSSEPSTVRTSPFVHSATAYEDTQQTIVTPQAGDQYVVERLPAVPAMDLKVNSPYSAAVCLIDSLSVVQSSGPISGIALRANSSETRHMLRFCELKAERLGADRAIFLGCRLTSLRVVVRLLGDLRIFGGATGPEPTVTVISENSRVVYEGNHLIQNAAAQLGVLGILWNFGGLAIFDNAAPSIAVYAGGVFKNQAALWGVGPGTAPRIDVRTGGVFAYETVPSITGGGPEVNLGGTTVSFATSSVNTSNGATYAQETSLSNATP